MRPRLVVALPILLACTCGPTEDVLGEFRAAKAEATADPGPAPAAFAPDLLLHLSPGLVDRLVEAGLEDGGRIQGRVKAGTSTFLRPDLKVRRVDLAPGRDALQADVHLDGTVTWSSGGGHGEVPITVDATLDVALATVAAKDGWTVTATPTRVRKLELAVPGLPKGLAKLARPPLEEQAQQSLGSIPPYTLLSVAADDLPVRGFRVVPEGAGLRVEMLSRAVRPGLVTSQASAGADWTLQASAQSLVWVARKAAFEARPQSYDVVPVPESLALHGTAFTLGLRLWRIEDPGWWRDYRATGKVTLDGPRIRLAADGVEEIAHSSGAGLADPLALLGQGLVVDAIGDALRKAVPASGGTVAGGRKVDVQIQRVSGNGDAIEVAGALTLGR